MRYYIGTILLEHPVYITFPTRSSFYANLRNMEEDFLIFLIYYPKKDLNFKFFLFNPNLISWIVANQPLWACGVPVQFPSIAYRLYRFEYLKLRESTQY